MTTATAVTVWHFAADKLRDGRPLPKAGETLVHEGKVVPCEKGLHGSVRALDALQFAPGHFVARCELRGDIVPHGKDKMAASERHYLTGYVDVSRVLHEFACWCATSAMDAYENRTGNKMGQRSRRAVEVKLLWLDGEAADADLAAARDAARDAAMDATWAAAMAAAMAAARDAARDAAMAAAMAAARDAARDAALDAAIDAARDATWAAAMAATWAAAMDATMAAQCTELEHRLTEALGVKP